MRNCDPIAVLALLLALPAAGCRLPGSEGAVSRSLATCRQFSRQGVAALERGQWQQAETLLAKAVAACPADPDARRHYAETLWRRGARQEAIAQLDEACRLAEEEAALHVRMAQMRLAVGQVEHARRSVQLALDLNPELPDAWAMRARVMRADGRLRQALADYHRALGYAPDDRQILLEIAELYRQLNRPQRALANLQSLAESYSPGEEPQQVLHLTGLAYLALGRADDAAESLSAAVTRGEPTPELFCLLGEAELLAGRPAEAVAAARQALALRPQHRLGRELLDRVELVQKSQTPIRR